MTLKETTPDKNLQYRADYNDRPSHSISFMPTAASGVQLAQKHFHFRHTEFSHHPHPD